MIKSAFSSLLVISVIFSSSALGKDTDWECSSSSECRKSSINQDFIFTQTQPLYLNLVHDNKNKTLFIGLHANSFRESDKEYFKKPKLIPAKIFFDGTQGHISTNIISFGRGMMMIPVGMDPKNPALWKDYFIPTMQSSKSMTIELKPSEYSRASSFSWQLDDTLLVAALIEQNKAHEYVAKMARKAHVVSQKQPITKQNKQLESKIPKLALKSASSPKEKQLNVKNKPKTDPRLAEEQALSKKVINCEAKAKEKVQFDNVKCTLNRKDSYLRTDKVRLNLDCNGVGKTGKTSGFKATCFFDEEILKSVHTKMNKFDLPSSP